MGFKRTIFVSTKKSEGGTAVTTELTLDATNLSEAGVVEYAMKHLVVKVQQTVFRTGEKAIPTKYTYIVPEPGTRAVAQPMTDDELMAELEKRGLQNTFLKKVEAYMEATEATE